jgi:pilus assembly protein CpaF
MEGEVITMQEIFAFEQRGVTPDARIKGVFLSRGIRPKFASKFEAKGIRLPDTIFDPRNVVEV